MMFWKDGENKGNHPFFHFAFLFSIFAESFAVENFDHKTLSDQDLFVNNKKLYKYLVHISKYRTFAAAN